MDCFGTYFTHVQTCSVTRVQSAPRGSYYKVFNEAWHNPIAALLGPRIWNLTVAYRCIAWTVGLHWHSSLRHPRADMRGALLSHAYSGRQLALTNGQAE